MILDGGRVTVGIESTVLDMTEPSRPVILRLGAISETCIIQSLSIKE